MMSYQETPVRQGDDPHEYRARRLERWARPGAYRRYVDCYDEDFEPLPGTTPHGLPLDSPALRLPIEEDPRPWGETDPIWKSKEEAVPGAADRFLARWGRWVTTKYGDCCDEYRGFRWDDHWRDVEAGRLAEVFAPGELARLEHSSAVESQVHRMIRYEPVWQVWHKVGSGMWRWGMGGSFNLAARIYRAIPSFDFGAGDEFDTVLDMTTGYNERGYSRYNRATNEDPGKRSLYLDGAMGFVIRRRGQPVLTIGWSPSRHGILVHQVQLWRPRGNRWLYSLPAPYLEHALSRVRATFPGLDVRLVTGESAALAHRRAWGDHHPVSAALDRRIAAIYDGPLGALRRGEVVECGGSAFAAVLPRDEEQVA